MDDFEGRETPEALASGDAYIGQSEGYIGQANLGLGEVTGEVTEGRRSLDAGAFIDAYPEVAEALRADPDAIPTQVWQRVGGGESLVDAYRDYERERQFDESQKQLLELKAQLLAAKQGSVNANRSTGSLHTDGADAAGDPIHMGWNSV